MSGRADVRVTTTSSRDELISSLRRVLAHEQRLGHANSAVRGGLKLFLDNWLQRWPTDERVLAARIVAPFADYSVAGVNTRRQVVEQALRSTVDPSLLLDYDGTRSTLPSDRSERGSQVGVTPTVTDAPPPPPPQPTGGPPIAIVAPPSRRRRLGAEPNTAPASPRPAHSNASDDLESPVEALRGVGPANAERLAKLGVRTIRDLLYHFPRRHLDYRNARLIRDLTFEEYETILATVWRVKVEQRPGGLVIIRAIIGDESGTAEAVWVRRKDFISRELPTNRSVVLSGECRLVGGRPVFRDPDWEPFSGEDTVHTARLVPVYPLVEGLNGRFVRRLAKQAIDRYVSLVVDHLPASIRSEQSLLDLSSAISQAHFPDSDELRKAALRRLAFDELLALQLGLLARRRARTVGDPAPGLSEGEGAVQAFIASLPFNLTGAQKRALHEVRRRLADTTPMALLLEGDVGSGKTVVAAAAAAQAAANGYQTAIMAPTEILAEQHFRTFERLFAAVGPAAPKVGLLTGAVKGVERRQIYAAVHEGSIAIVAGTQALLQERLDFARLGLVVVDEQHRFGVVQRGALRKKGYNPHVLAMTATPIPRTLALTLFGDLDVERLDELPPGRQTIKTRHLAPSDRPRAYEFVRREVGAGHQAFIVYPLVEESSRGSEARAATAEFVRLSTEVFPSLRVDLLHGRMKPEEKESIMRRFQRHEFDVLVTTSVIEVGIDIPNATVMLVEGANRFGLAQLHQFRGRVGRGADQSYCLLIADSQTSTSEQRLSAIENTNDGFALAQVDLEIRGPGEFLGTRQSGLPDLRMAQLTDIASVQDSRAAALKLSEFDPDLERPEHRLLRVKVTEFWARGSALA